MKTVVMAAQSPDSAARQQRSRSVRCSSSLVLPLARWNHSFNSIRFCKNTAPTTSTK